MKRLAGSELKAYFKDPQKVTSWWKPEEGSYRFWHDQEFKILDKHLAVRKGWKVLDAACGQGRFTRYYAHKGCAVSALDINAEMLKIAAERAQKEGVLGRVQFFEGDLETFSAKKEEFDLVTCMDALDHMDDVNLACKNLAAPLKKGGHFIITYTCSASFYGLLRDLYTVISYRRQDGEVDIGRSYTFSQIKEALNGAGIRIRGVFGIGLLMAPQERVRFPLLLNRMFEGFSRLDVSLKSYHANNWFARHCSGVLIMGTRD